MYEAEKGHWWYRGMEIISSRVIEKYYPRGSHLKILDDGCGTGGSFRYLRRYGTYTGIDLSSTALDFCRTQTVHNLVNGSALQLPFRPAAFEFVVSYDVLSMMEPEQESKSIQEINRVLMPGGHLLLRLPAYNWLKGAHDQAVSTRHRYHRRELLEKLELHGFHCDWISYANTFLFPFIALKRWSDGFRPQQGRSDLSLPLRPWHSLFYYLLRLEALLLGRIRLPFGLTVIALARKT